ncbi:TetR family transcriptional regulator [Kitasatospora herbaricolor]|uniref:TetR/AcrR family transcriptional regulator n=1 Tax=Kitasatospora herbaricolor TaxID=68217 RepID=UPI00174C1305|nr:TetR family transcriptional regulator [Kitasatospora herbaricolor]MDQ0313041.1 AcrR family transcriptional regulator [Kitasatospora herbaricolor]GGV24587.1 TetR family transcriptional regulator [Kitasatospora herbaricolor]
MNARTVDWSAGRVARDGTGRAEGLRERKKRLMRQQLSDTATEMFVERGFEAVRVAEVAAACGVSEKTVFNYFPTKESLVLDMPEVTMTALREELARPELTPVEAALRVLADELGALISWLEEQEDPALAVVRLRRFGAMVQATPSLRAHQRDMTDRLVAAAAETLAARSGADPEDPEPQIAATALLGLWPIQFRSLRTHLDGVRTPPQVREAVTGDVLRAARLLAAGLDGPLPAGAGPARP